MSSANKAAREARVREFAEITGASTIDSTRFLKATSYRLDAALDAFYNDPAAVRAAEQQRQNGAGGASARNLEKLWERYREADNPDEIHFEGTIHYCQDLGVDPTDMVMLAVAWLTKAPTMGHFTKKNWIEGWREARRDTIELQKAYIERLRQDLKQADIFRKVYAFTFDYAKTEGQKSMQLDIARELWNMLVPADPGSHFPSRHLEWWQDFLDTRGSRPVSKDTWNLFLEFTRTIDPAFAQHDEEAAWPSLIDDFVDHARKKIAEEGAGMDVS